jgi:hypothetical protein
MKKIQFSLPNALLATMSLGFLLSSASVAWGQGCVVARSSSPEMGPENQGGYLEPGDFEVNIGYRHQFSYKHFVGDVEQTYRVQQGNQVMNKINLENVNLTYQISQRFSVAASLPILFASRRSHNAYQTTTSSGIGDSSVLVSGWLLNPKRAHSGNFSIGLGLSMPTGRDDVKNNLSTSPGAAPVLTTVDYSIQPGQGGWGGILQWQGFKNLGKSVVYMDGSYLATQGGYNNVLRNATALNQPLTAYNAIQDQYLLEAGVSHPVSRVKGLTVTFGPRWEGVPAKNVFGNDLGFRRPGYAVSLAPGIIYVRGSGMLTASVGKALLRDRTRSVPDRILGAHGDAAFADYVWFLNYTYRIPKKGNHEN